MLARIGAAVTLLGAGAHMRVVAEALAVLRATLADIGAHAACAAMHIRTTQH